jgi:glycosyltransferase involved in cell wall biosynthesis
MGAPLVIGLDIRPALSRATGVGRYFQGLLSGLQVVDRENTYVLFTSSLKERPADVERPSNFVTVDRRVPVRALNLLWNRLGAPSFDLLAGRRADVVHSPTPLVVPSRSARSVVTICDLFFLDHRDATRAEIRRDYAALVRSHVQKADAIVAISDTTARDVIDRLGVSEERLCIIPAGADARFLHPLGDSEEKESPEPPFVLAVATEEPRKNLPRLIEAMAVLESKRWDGRLVIAGGRGLDSPGIDEAVSRLGLAHRVTRLGYVRSDELPALYRRARAVVLPSVWEGFGLPLLEAMASGTPVVASDIPVHREVAGEAAIFVAGEDASSIAEGIETVWCDEAVRRRLVEAGRARVDRFSWERSARKAVELYRRVALS